MTVVGVAAPAFHGIDVGEVPVRWIPASMASQVIPGFNGLRNRHLRWMQVLGQIFRPGLSPESAQAGPHRTVQSPARRHRRDGFPRSPPPGARASLPPPCNSLRRPKGTQSASNPLPAALGAPRRDRRFSASPASTSPASSSPAAPPPNARSAPASPSAPPRPASAVSSSPIASFSRSPADSSSRSRARSPACPHRPAQRYRRQRVARHPRSPPPALRLPSASPPDSSAASRPPSTPAANLSSPRSGNAAERRSPERTATPHRCRPSDSPHSTRFTPPHSHPFVDRRPPQLSLGVGTIPLPANRSPRRHRSRRQSQLRHSRLLRDPRHRDRCRKRLRRARLPPARQRRPRVAIVNQAFVRRYLGGRPIGVRIAEGSGPDIRPTVEIVGVMTDFNYRGLRDQSEQPAPLSEASPGGAFYVKVRGASSRPGHSRHRPRHRCRTSHLPPQLGELVNRSLNIERLLAALALFSRWSDSTA